KLIETLERRELEEAGPHSYKCVHVPADELREALERMLKGGRGPEGGPVLTLVSDERANTLRLDGPANLIRKARDILAQLDTAVAGRARWPWLNMYQVPVGNAEMVAKELEPKSRGKWGLKIIAVSTPQLAVWGSPAEQMAVASDLRALARDPRFGVPLI